MTDNNEDLGRANASGLDGIEFLINDLKVGGVIDFNGKKIRFDDETNLMNFKLGLVLGATIANKPINLTDNSK